MPGRPTRASLQAVLAALLLAGCGGGGGGGSVRLDSTPPPPVPRPGPRPTSLRLHIAAVHITQGTQTVDGRVPLVQGRPGCLRVFLLAGSWTGPGPAVRVRLRDAHGHELLDREILPPGRGVPAELRDEAPGESWDLPLPGKLIQPGLTVEAELLVPPGDARLEPGGRTFPADGKPLHLDVRPVPVLRLNLVPIQTHGRVGRINEGGRTTETWLAELRALFPLADIDLRVDPPFVTSQDFTGHANVFPAVLEELDAWRLLDERNNNRYFYGVIPLDRPSSNGMLGLGFTGIRGSKYSRTAIGIDGIDRLQPHYDYPTILVHELGHTFGRYHAPCGVRATDLTYPRPDGHLDACGFDLRSNRPVAPDRATDIMGYCADKWVSRHTYEGIMNFRAGDRLAESSKVPLAASPAQDCLLVWGGGEGGRMTLTAALRVHRRPLPPPPGDYRLECVDGAGRVIQSTPFAPAAVGDEDGAVGFSLVLPMPPGGEAALAELRVTHEGQVRAVLRPSGHAGRTSPGPKARRGAGGVVHFTWDAAAFPRVLVKEAAGGANLALGAGGSLDLHTGAKALDCTFSDGLHSVRHPVRVE